MSVPVNIKRVHGASGGAHSAGYPGTFNAGPAEHCGGHEEFAVAMTISPLVPISRKSEMPPDERIRPVTEQAGGYITAYIAAYTR